MDSTAHISGLIDQLDNNLDNLQDALKGILNKSLTDVAADYPMLDRAKFYILITYAIESAVFSFLRLTGTSAREHPVYRELERVKQYFQKAKLAEVTLQKPVMRLDQAAAGRFIKAALASNDAMAVRNKERPKTEAAGMTNGSSESDVENSRKRKAADMEKDSGVPVPTNHRATTEATSTFKATDEKSEAESDSSTKNFTVPASSKVKPEAALPGSSNTTESEGQKAAKRKAKKARKRERKLAQEAQAAQESTGTTQTETPPAKKKQKKDKEKSSTANS